MRAWVMIAVLSGALSCSAPCVPGEMAACTCADGAPGARVCRASGAFDPCTCESPALVPVTPDAGVEEIDAGPEIFCNLNQSAPSPSYALPPQALRVPTGGVELRFAEQFTFDFGSVWSLTYNVTGNGVAKTLPGDGGSAWLDLATPGTYQLDVTVHWLCGESHVLRSLEVVAARRWPYEITHGACCDDEQRAFVSVTRPPRVLRLELDGGTTEVAQLTRAISSLALNFDRSELVVAQDSVVSVFDVNTLAPTSATAIGLQRPLAWWARDWVWAVESDAQGSVSTVTRVDPVGDQVTSVPVSFFSPPTMLAVADATTAVLCSTSSMRALIASAGGGLTSISTGSCCGGVFATSVPGTILSGCGELQTFVDGGFRYDGTFSLGRPQIIAAAPGPDAGAWVVINEYPGFSLRELALDSLETRSTRPVGIVDPKLVSPMSPSFMFVDANGVTRVFTPAQDLAGTSWEETSP